MPNTDQVARDAARDAMGAISAHEKVCAERYGAVRGQLSDIKTVLAWGAAGLVGSLGSIIMLLLQGHGS